MSWLDELAKHIVPAASAALHGVGDVMQKSEDLGKDTLGQISYGLARASPGDSLDYLNLQRLWGGDYQSEQEILDAYENGRGKYHGGRAAFEGAQGVRPAWERGLVDVANPVDPINALGYMTGIGAVREGMQSIPRFGRAITQAAEAGKYDPGIWSLGAKYGGRAIANTGNLTWAAIRATEIPGELVFKGTGKIIGAPFKYTKTGRYLMESPVKVKSQIQKNNIFSALTERWGNEESQMTRGFATDLTSGFRADDMEKDYFRVSPFHVNETLRGSVVGEAAQGRVDNAYTSLRAKLSMRSNQALGFVHPGMGKGTPVGTVAKFTRSDIRELATIVGGLMVGKLGSFGESVRGMQNLSQELASHTGYLPEQIEPVLPTILKEAEKTTGLQLPDPIYSQSTGLPDRGAALNVKGDFAAERLGNIPSGTFGVGNEASLMGAGTVLGHRVDIDPNDVMNQGTGAPFAIGGELYNPQLRVEVKPTAAGKKAGIKKSSNWYGKDELPGLQELVDKGFAEIKTQGAGVNAPKAYRELLEDPTKVGPGGVRFGHDGQSAIQLIDEAMRKEFGVSWDNTPQAVKDRVFDQATQYSYQLFVESAQTIAVSTSEAAERYLAGIANPERSIVDDLFRKKAAETDPGRLQNVENAIQATRKQGVTPYGATAGEGVRVEDSAAAVFEKDLQEGTKVLEDPAYKRNVHGQIRDDQGISKNPVGGFPLNFGALMHALKSGHDLDMGNTLVRDWYHAAAQEMIQLFGPDNIDAVARFAALTAATSSQAGPEQNMKSAARLLAISLGGLDTSLAQEAGLTRGQVMGLQQLLTDFVAVARQGTEVSVKRAGKTKKVKIGTMSPSSYPHLGEVSMAHSRSGGGALAGIADVPNTSRQQGVKFNDYGYSKIINAVRDQVIHQYGDNPELRDDILQGLLDASAHYTPDRHEGTLMGWGTEVSPVQQRVRRYMGRVTSRMSGLPTEAAQAITWYYSKGAKGFSRAAKDDDLSSAMAKMMQEHGIDTMEPGAKKRAFVAAMVKDVLSKGHYVEPGRLDGNRINTVAKHFTDLLPSLKEGVRRPVAERPDFTQPFTGGTFRLADPEIYKELPKGGVDELQMIRGYAVGLTGTPMMPLDNQVAIGQAIKEVLKKYKPVLEGPYGDHIKLGLFRDGNEASFDLSVVLPDRADAERVGKELNQMGIFGFKEEAEKEGSGYIMTGGTGDPVIQTPEEINDYLTKLIDDPLGATPPKPPRSPESTGIVNEQLNLADNQIHQMVAPILDAYNESRFAKFLGTTREEFGNQEWNRLAGPTMDKVLQGTRPTKNPMLSDKANQVLEGVMGVGTFEGKTVNEAYDEAYSEIARLQDALKAQGVKWAPETKLADKKALVAGKDLKDTLTKYDKFGVNLLDGDAKKVAADILMKATDEAYGVTKEANTGYRMLRAAWAEQALASVRFHTSNFWGGNLQLLIGGYGIKINPMEFVRNVRSAFGQELEHFSSPTRYPTKWMDTLDRYGFGDAPMQLKRTNATAGITGDQSTSSAVGKLAAKITGSDRLGKVIGKPFEWNKKFAAGTEMMLRGSIFSDVMDAEMHKANPRMVRELATAAERSGVDVMGLPDNVFWGAPERVKGDLLKAGFKDGQAEHISRLYANVRREAYDKGLSEVNRVQFSYEFNNLDEMISKVVPFHYWASRATRFYGENALRHPILIYDYARLTEGMEKMQEDPGLNARSKGFIRMMQGPVGFSLLMNPEALFGVVKTFQLDSNYTPDGETEIGKIIRMGKERGIGMLPWIDAMFNYMGAYGETFEPDPAGVRVRALVGSGIQYLSAVTGESPPIAPYAGANAKIREWVSGFTSTFTPDWLSAPVSAKASRDGSTATATLDDLITSRIMEQNPNITNQQLLDILSDPDSKEYSAAYKSVAQAGLLGQILNFTAPTNFKVRMDSRDADMAGLNVIRDEATKQGVSPGNVTPTVGDKTFETLYEQQTGKKFNPNDYNKMQLRRDLAAAPPEAQPFIIQDSEYHEIGSPTARKVAEDQQKIRSGEWLPPGLSGNFDPDTLDAIANRYAELSNAGGEVEQMRQLQKAYRNQHPEYDEFKQWQSMMYNISANYGVDGFALYRSKVSATNPNARVYFASQAERIRNDHPDWTPEKMRKELDRATIGPTAWFAVTGRIKSQYNSAPLPTNGPDPATVGAYAQQAQPQNQPQMPRTWAQALATYAR